MYEEFGVVAAGNNVTFKLFFPDSNKDPAQYIKGGIPHIKNIKIVGDFQGKINYKNWNINTAPEMTKQDHPKGWLYDYKTTLPDGFYQYKFFVTFENGEQRWCNDPCTKYSGQDPNHENSAFVVGGNRVQNVKPIANRLTQKDLIIYEIMIDDFVEKLFAHSNPQIQGKAPLDIIREKIDYLVDLGINAVEFMPWTATYGRNFSWGYNPFLYFAVEDRYTNPKSPELGANLDRLFRLQMLIDELHSRNIHVIMDGVFNHVDVDKNNPGRGFPYYWLYQNPQDSPFVGNFEGGGFLEELNFDNKCTQEFIFDVCKYWLDTYQIDGIRFDYTLGFFRRDGVDPGISRLISNLRGYLYGTNRTNIALMIEHLTDNRYQAIDDTNRIGATGCWYDPLMFQAFDSGASGNVNTSIMRDLHTSRDFYPGNNPVIYIENHDHSTLVNKVGGSRVGVSREENWFKTQPYAMALLTLPGTVLIHNGQEFGDEYYLPESGSDRVRSRPVNWERSTDFTGSRLIDLYKKLIQIRKDYSSLRSPFFYPDNYDERNTKFNNQGYGVDIDKDVIIYHRWGIGKDGKLEKFIIVLNCSSFEQFVDVPFPHNGRWQDLLNDEQFQVEVYWLNHQKFNSNWGRIYYAKV